MDRVLRSNLKGRALLSLVVIVGSGLILTGCMSLIMPTQKDVSREINITKEIKFEDGYEKTEKACEDMGSVRVTTEATTQISSDTSVTERMCVFKGNAFIYLSIHNEKGLMKKAKVKYTTYTHSIGETESFIRNYLSILKNMGIE